MGLNERITRLFGLLSGRDPDIPPVPERWTERGADGRMVGPSPGDQPTPGQLTTLHQLGEMDQRTAPDLTL